MFVDARQEPPSQAQIYGNQFEGTFEQNLSNLSDQLLIDVAVSGRSKPQATRDRHRLTLRSRTRSSRPSPTISMPGSPGRSPTSVWETIRNHSMTFRS